MMRVFYIGYVFSVEKEIRISPSSGLYFKLQAIDGIVYPKRILKIVNKSAISADCVDKDSNKEICDVQQSV